MRYYVIGKGMANFLLKPSFQLQKIKKIPKYTRLYSKGLQFNQQLKQTYRRQFSKAQQQVKIQKLTLNSINQLKKNIQQRIKQVQNKKQSIGIQQVGNINAYDTVKNYMQKGLKFLQLYYQSLQNLVQGKRQVIHNQQFRFEDGETVKQKSEKLQKILIKITGKTDKFSSKKQQEQ